MAKFAGIELTNTGLSMLSKATGAGSKLTFTCFKLGSGQLADTDNTKTFTDLKEPLLTAQVHGFKDQGNGLVDISAIVSNSAVNTGFFVREVGIFAKLDDGTEQLYAYANCGNYADYIPDKTEPVDENEICVSLIVAEAQNITATIDASIIYPTQAQMQENVTAAVSTHDNNAAAHGALMTAHNADTNAHSALITILKTQIQNSGINILGRNKTYIVGDIAYSTNLPSWARLECVVGGKTALEEPTWGTTAAVLVADGTATWIIDDMRDGGLAGDISYKMYLKIGHIKANGATVNRADYPRLVKLVTDNNLFYDGLFTGTTTANSATISGISANDTAKLKVGMVLSGDGVTTGTTIKAVYAYSIDVSLVQYLTGPRPFAYTGFTTNANNCAGLFGIGNGNTTFVLPNLIGLFVEGGDDAGKFITAGLPNITGRYVDLGFDVSATGTGAMYNAGSWGDRAQHNDRTGGQTSIGFNASLSNAIYGASTTVQPPAIKMIPQIKY